MIVIWYTDKWYIKLFPAEKDNSSNTLAKLFQAEMTKMKVKGQPSFAKEKQKIFGILRQLESGRCYLKVANTSISTYSI